MTTDATSCALRRIAAGRRGCHGATMAAGSPSSTPPSRAQASDAKGPPGFGRRELVGSARRGAGHKPPPARGSPAPSTRKPAIAATYAASNPRNEDLRVSTCSAATKPAAACSASQCGHVRAKSGSPTHCPAGQPSRPGCPATWASQNACPSVTKQAVAKMITEGVMKPVGVEAASRLLAARPSTLLYGFHPVNCRRLPFHWQSPHFG